MNHYTAEKIVQPVKSNSSKMATVSVFSSERKIQLPKMKLAQSICFNKRLKMDGIKFLTQLPEARVPVAFFDPQYRGVLDKLKYGNEGKSRGKARSDLPQMKEETIQKFIAKINRILTPSGHLFLWMDKFHLCTGFSNWLKGTQLHVVDMITWNKKRMGMGYRTRRVSEYIIILQKEPRRAKGVWKVHTIPDTWEEEVKRNGHAHKKPLGLQGKLIEAVSHVGDVIVDPAAGSFSVMEACKLTDRHFLGCDING